jgi:hypothetical protein
MACAICFKQQLAEKACTVPVWPGDAKTREEDLCSHELVFEPVAMDQIPGSYHGNCQWPNQAI